MDYNRRAALKLAGGVASVAALALVPGCASTSGATPLQMAQAYGDDFVTLVMAAAAAYEAEPNPNPIVATVITDLQAAQAALDGATVASGAQGVVGQILAGWQKLAPFVSPFFGAAAPYIPLVIAVLEAFVAEQPPPAGATPTPPAAVHSAATKYRLSHQ